MSAAISWYPILGVITVVLALMGTEVKTEAQTMGLAPSGAQVGPYVANAVDFDGTNDFMTRGADLTSAVDDQQGILSIWLRKDGGDGSAIVLIDNAVNSVEEFTGAGNPLETRLEDTAGIDMWSDGSSVSITVDGNWRHFIMSWDMSVPTCQLYIDDVDEPVSTCDTGTPDGTTIDWFIAALNSGGSNKWNGCLAELYYHQTVHLDLDTTLNRRLFNDGTGGSAGGEPVSLGSDGSTPTSSQPIIYLNGGSSDFQTNQGSGGNFTVTGALDACSNSPTD